MRAEICFRRHYFTAKFARLLRSLRNIFALFAVKNNGYRTIKKRSKILDCFASLAMTATKKLCVPPKISANPLWFSAKPPCNSKEAIRAIFVSKIRLLNAIFIDNKKIFL